jgi:hypothetical protein
VMAYKAAHPSFPHETTMDQLFSEEQFEAYRALGEHITRRFLTGQDEAAIAADFAPEVATARIDLLFRNVGGPQLAEPADADDRIALSEVAHPAAE